MGTGLIERKNLSDEVIGKIKTYISTNSLKPGDRLPTEQQFSEEFGVSRNVVRESTKALSYLGIISSAPRRGIAVGELDMDRLAEYMGFHFAICNYPRKYLIQARIVIETGVLPYTIKMVVSDEELQKKLITLSEALTVEQDVEKYVDEDIEFHKTLVRASGNEPLMAINDLLHSFFFRFREEVAEAVRTKHESQSQYKGHHICIAKAICEGDLDSARRLLTDHLEFYENFEEERTD